MSAEFGETVKFPCFLTDTSISQTIPLWKVGYPNGTILTYTAGHFPKDITLAYDGINVFIQDSKFNMTNFTCSIQRYTPNLKTGNLSVTQIESHTGILTITFPSVSFHLISQHDIRVHVREGETVYFQVIKKGGENYTYNVTLHSTGKMYIVDITLYFMCIPIFWIMILVITAVH